MDVWSCYAPSCKEHVEFICSECSPGVYSCAVHAEEHMNRSRHEIVPLYSDPNPLTKNTILNHLSRKLETLANIERYIIDLGMIELKRIQENMSVALKNLKIVQEQYQRLIQKINNTSRIPALKVNKHHEILSQSTELAMQNLEKLIPEIIPGADRISYDLYSLAQQFALRPLLCVRQVMNELGNEPEIILENSETKKINFTSLRTVIDDYIENFKNHSSRINLAKKDPVSQQIQVQSSSEPLRKTYKEDLKAIMVKSALSNGNNAEPSNNDAYMSMSQATTLSAYSAYSTLSDQSAHSTL